MAKGETGVKEGFTCSSLPTHYLPSKRKFLSEIWLSVFCYIWQTLSDLQVPCSLYWLFFCHNFYSASFSLLSMCGNFRAEANLPEDKQVQRILPITLLCERKEGKRQLSGWEAEILSTALQFVFKIKGSSPCSQCCYLWLRSDGLLLSKCSLQGQA